MHACVPVRCTVRAAHQGHRRTARVLCDGQGDPRGYVRLVIGQWCSVITHVGLSDEDLAEMGIAPKLLRKSVLISLADLVKNKGVCGGVVVYSGDTTSGPKNASFLLPFDE